MSTLFGTFRNWGSSASLLHVVLVSMTSFVVAEVWIQKGVEPLGSASNGVKFKLRKGVSLAGTAVEMIAADSAAQCAYLCRRHLQCRLASFLSNSNECCMHNRATTNGTVTDQHAVTIDFMTADKTDILLIGGTRPGISTQDKVIHMIPENQFVQILDQTLDIVRTAFAAAGAAVYKNRIIIDSGLGTSGRLQSTEILEAVTLKHIDSSQFNSQKHAYGCSGSVGSVFYNCFGENDAGYISFCDMYDMANGNAYQRRNTGVPARRDVACVFAGNNVVYVLGGFMSPGGRRNEFYKVNLNTQTNTPLAPYALAFSNAPAVWFNGNIVVCGGNAVTIGTVTLCKKYIVAMDTWSPFAGLGTARYAYQLVNWGSDKLLAIAGINDTHGHKSVEVYSDGSWSPLMDLPYELIRFAAVALN